MRKNLFIRNVLEKLKPLSAPHMFNDITAKVDHRFQNVL